MDDYQPDQGDTPSSPQCCAPRSAGYSGNFCDTCGSVFMIRAGTCEVCSECGTTSGCS